MKTKPIFLDGQIVKARSEMIDSLMPGVVQGEGVFETMRVYNGRIFAIDRHFQRLTRGLRLFNIRSPYSEDQWMNNLYQTIRANSLREARIRLAIWKDQKKRHIAIVCQAISSDWVMKNKQGLTAMISTVKRNKTKHSNIKSLDYLCFRKAFKEAEDHLF